MIAESVMGDTVRLDGSSWGLMLAVSVILHLVVLSVAIFLSGVFQTREDEDVVYEVDLVSMPASSPQNQAVAASKPESVIEEGLPAKKPLKVEEKKIPIPAEKPAINIKKPVIKKVETPVNNVDAAIAKLQKTVKAEGGEHLDQAISDLEKKNRSEEGHLGSAMARLQSKTVGTSLKEGKPGTGSGGFADKIYKGQITSQIQSNWTYPTAMQSKKDLEVKVLLKVREDGAILESKFIKKSRDSVFDESVKKAIERSNPLLPFPEGYNKSYDEIEVTFNLKDLLGKD